MMTNPANIQPANILIVDDIEMNRDLLSRIVTKLGHSPILADGGRVALEKVKTQPIDLVLLDIMMPEVDGYEVLSSIKDDASLRHIPVIMVTAVHEPQSAVDCIKMRADDYLTKPVNRVLLKARMGACLERKSLRDKEKEYLHQIEEAHFRLEEVLCEQTKELTIAKEELQILEKAKDNALKLIYYDVQNSLGDLNRVAKVRVNKLLKTWLETIKRELPEIEPSTVMFVFELNAVHAILQSAIELATELAQSRQVSMGPMPDCGGQPLTPPPLQPDLDFDEEELSSASSCPVDDEEQDAVQKERYANALAELIKTAVKFSRHGSTVTFSCTPLQQEVSIGIHATGRTIFEDELSQFFEVPSNTEKVTPGRHPGLGPSTAKHIITSLLGGSVTVANREAAGISFVVKLKRDGLGSCG